jgi:hypothetical protein
MNESRLVEAGKLTLNLALQFKALEGQERSGVLTEARWPPSFLGGADASNSAALIAGGFNTAIPSAKMLAYPESQQDFW